jgi:hypothetical protein
MGKVPARGCRIEQPRSLVFFARTPRNKDRAGDSAVRARAPLPATFLALLLSALGAAPVSAQAMPAAQRQAVAKGLQWLASQQQKDGHWQVGRDQGVGAAVSTYPVPMTALAGMAFLMEGSTRSSGKYQENLRRAVAWLIDRCGRDGLIGSPGEGARNLFGHGYALLFLACVYEREKTLPPPADVLEEASRKGLLRQLEPVLKRAVAYIAAARTTRGAWGYMSPMPGTDFDEAAPTAVQVQALLAARHAGIPIPEDVLAGGLRYLKAAVLTVRAPDGKFGRELPPVLFAAVALALQAGQGEAPHVKDWVRGMPGVVAQRGVECYCHYYEAQARYLLGDKGLAGLLKRLLDSQAPDGSWAGSFVGPLYDTATHLTALQLENRNVSFYRKKR